jgi:hypothetical protein
MDQIKGLVTNDQSPPEWKKVTTTVSLAAYETRVHVTAAAADYVITLPPIGECEGRGFYVIKRMLAAGGAFGPTVKSKESDAGGTLYTSGELTALADFLILWTDGMRWYEIKELTT